MSCSGWALAEWPELIWVASVKEVADWIVGVASHRVRVLQLEKVQKVMIGVEDKNLHGR